MNLEREYFYFILFYNYLKKYYLGERERERVGGDMDLANEGESRKKKLE